MSEFENLLKKTNEARKNTTDVKEYAESLSKMFDIKLKEMFGKHKLEILSVDEKLRNNIKEAVRKSLDEALKEVENNPSEVDL